MFGGFDLSRHWQAPKKAKKTKHNLTKHWQAPKKTKKKQRFPTYGGPES